MFLMFTEALRVLFKRWSSNTRCSLLVLCCSYNVRRRKAEFSFWRTTVALSFTLSIDSPLTSRFQHFGIYTQAVRTSTRGLWSPIKLYFVQSSKWSDHKPSNRGINSQYWPVFRLRPAPMASFQNFKDRPPAQTFARLEKANEARSLECEEMLDAFPGLTGSDTLDDCLDRCVKRVFHVNPGSHKITFFRAFHVVVRDKNLWIRGVADMFTLTLRLI